MINKLAGDVALIPLLKSRMHKELQNNAFTLD